MDGTLPGEFDKSDSEEIKARLRDADEAAQDEVWAGYRYVALYDTKSETGITVIDLGAGHANAGETLTGRVITTLKSRALLNESPGAGYLERRWAEPFKKSGAWPVSALRQAFLNGTLERLLEPDSYLKAKLPGFVMNGDFGYASGAKGDGYSRVWFRELLPQEEISFDSDVYLLIHRPKPCTHYVGHAGQEVTAEVFASGQHVDVTGKSKGKGTAGVMKRHGFKVRAADEPERKHRSPGSIGARHPRPGVQGRADGGPDGRRAHHRAVTHRALRRRRARAASDQGRGAA